MKLPTSMTLRHAPLHILQHHEKLRLQRLCRRRRTLVLTYDDGPGSALTPPLLDLLRNYNAQATFFPLGCRGEANPELMDRIHAAGHEIGSHTFAHLHAWIAPAEHVRNDIDRGYAALASWIAPDALFRPPHGKLTISGRSALQQRGAVIGWWTSDSGDTAEMLPDMQDTIDHVRRSAGGVVLMHDFDREADADDRSTFVLTLTEQLLKAAQTDGLTVATLGSLLHHAHLQAQAA